MKKFAALLLAVVLMLGAVSAMADVTIGQVQYSAHGTKAFAVLTVAMDGDTIVAAHIDEYQLMPVDSITPVPNAENMMADLYAAGQALGSKRLNNAYYSGNMATRAGATAELAAGYQLIEAFVTGKTIAELEAILAETENMLDAVSGCTLVDTRGYVEGLVAAARAAQ